MSGTSKAQPQAERVKWLDETHKTFMAGKDAAVKTLANRSIRNKKRITTFETATSEAAAESHAAATAAADALAAQEALAARVRALEGDVLTEGPEEPGERKKPTGLEPPTSFGDTMH